MLGIQSEWFHERIRERNLTQKAVAREMKMHPSTLHRLLTGEQRMTIYHVQTLVAILGISVDDLFRNMGVPLK